MKRYHQLRGTTDIALGFIMIDSRKNRQIGRTRNKPQTSKIANTAMTKLSMLDTFQKYKTAKIATIETLTCKPNPPTSSVIPMSKKHPKHNTTHIRNETWPIKQAQLIQTALKKYREKTTLTLITRCGKNTIKRKTAHHLRPNYLTNTINKTQIKINREQKEHKLKPLKQHTNRPNVTPYIHSKTKQLEQYPRKAHSTPKTRNKTLKPSKPRDNPPSINDHTNKKEKPYNLHITLKINRKEKHLPMSH